MPVFFDHDPRSEAVRCRYALAISGMDGPEPDYYAPRTVDSVRREDYERSL